MMENEVFMGITHEGLKSSGFLLITVIKLVIMNLLAKDSNLLAAFF